MDRFWGGSALGSVGEEVLRILPLVAMGIGILLVFIALGQGMRWWFNRRKVGGDWNRVRGSMAAWGLTGMGLAVALLATLPLGDAQLLWILTAFIAGGLLAMARVVPEVSAGLRVLGSTWFQAGDEISVDGFSGTVMGSDVRTTTLRTCDGRMAVIPNGWLVQRPFTNDTTLRKRRSTASLELSVDEDLAYAVVVIKDAIVETQGVMNDPPPTVSISSLADRRVTINVHWWTAAKPIEIDRVRDSVIFSIRCALRDAQVALPSSGEQFFVDCIRSYDEQERPRERQSGLRDQSQLGDVRDPFAV